jgi:hypothetical protein
MPASTAAADDGRKQLDELAKADHALKLDAMQLPPGEKDARDGESRSTNFSFPPACSLNSTCF